MCLNSTKHWRPRASVRTNHVDRRCLLRPLKSLQSNKRQKLVLAGPCSPPSPQSAAVWPLCLHQQPSQRKSCRSRATAYADATPGGEQPPAWRKVVAVTAGCLLLCNLHRNTFSVLLPDLAHQLGLRTSQIGAVQAAMLTAYLLGQIPAGRLADKYGGSRVLLWGLAIWSAATALAAAAGLGVNSPSSNGNSSWALMIILASRVLMGLASACAMPCVTAVAVKWVPSEERASMISFVYANFNVGGVIGLTLIPLLADALGGEAAFIISGAVGVAWAVLGAAVINTNNAAAAGNKHGRVTTKQQQQQQRRHELSIEHKPQPHQQGSDQQQQHQEDAQVPWGLSRRSWQQVAVLCYAHATIGFGFFLMQSFIPMLLASLGSDSLTLTGRLSSMPWLAAAVVGMMAGVTADSLIRNGLPTLFVRRLMQGLSFLGCGLSVLPLAVNSSPGLLPAVWCLTANLMFYSLSYGGFHAYLQDVAGKYAGVLQGVTNSASILMGIVSNVLTGFAVEATGSYSSVFWVLGLAYISAAVVWCLCTSSHRLQASS